MSENAGKKSGRGATRKLPTPEEIYQGAERLVAGMEVGRIVRDHPTTSKSSAAVLYAAHDELEIVSGAIEAIRQFALCSPDDLEFVCGGDLSYLLKVVNDRLQGAMAMVDDARPNLFGNRDEGETGA
jgi:hypothetical protein